jgi:hypothetical protein
MKCFCQKQGYGGRQKEARLWRENLIESRGNLIFKDVEHVL